MSELSPETKEAVDVWIANFGQMYGTSADICLAQFLVLWWESGKVTAIEALEKAMGAPVIYPEQTSLLSDTAFTIKRLY